MSKPILTREPPEALPLQTRTGVITRLAPSEAPAADADGGLRRYRVLFSTGAEVKRSRWTGWDTVERYVEELVISDEAVDMTRVDGGAPFLADHYGWSIGAVMGRTENGKVEKGAAYCDVVFPRAGTDEKIDRVVSMIEQGILRSVSAGYIIDRVRIVEGEKKGDLARHIVERWTPLEISLVAIPADAGAQVQRSETGGEGGTALRTFPVTFVQPTATPPASRSDNQEKDDMSKPVKAGDPAANAPEQERAAADPAVQTPPAPEREQPTSRLAPKDVLSLRTQAVALGVKPEDADEILGRDGLTRSAASEAILAKAAERSAAQPKQDGRVDVLRDEGDTLRRDLEGVLVSRLTHGAVKMPETAGERRSFGFTDFAAELVGHKGRMRTWGEREEVLKRAFHSVSDFPAIYENVLNKSLAARYALAAPTYRELAVKRDFKDFRPHPIVRPGDFPTLVPIGEGGEIKFGTFGEKKETASVLAYAIGVRLSREMMVNDDLGAIADVLANQGDMVAIFEDRTFYAALLSNAGAGPALLEGAANMFGTGAGRGNLAGAGTAITVTALSAGRAAMRKMKSLGGQNLNLGPSIILVGPDKETEAQQLLAPIQAQQAGNVNPFSGTLKIVTTAEISGNPWYLFANPPSLPNFSYGYLEGYAAPRVRVENPFGTQGSALTVEHDFGVGAIDYRGAYRNPGA